MHQEGSMAPLMPLSSATPPRPLCPNNKTGPLVTQEPQPTSVPWGTEGVSEGDEWVPRGGGSQEQPAGEVTTSTIPAEANTSTRHLPPYFVHPLASTLTLFYFFLFAVPWPLLFLLTLWVKTECFALRFPTERPRVVSVRLSTLLLLGI